MNSNQNLTHWNGIPLKSLSSEELISIIQQLWKEVKINNPSF